MCLGGPQKLNRAHLRCSRGLEEEEVSRKSYAALLAKTPARNQTGCGQTVKLLKETAAKPQKAKTEREEIYLNDAKE